MTTKNKKIAIIGLGYVGLPLAIEFGKKYRVIGFDIDQARINELLSGNDRTREADIKSLNFSLGLAKQSQDYGLSLSSNVLDISSCNIYIVTVPTPIDRFKSPNLNPLLNASKLKLTH